MWVHVSGDRMRFEATWKKGFLFSICGQYYRSVKESSERLSLSGGRVLPARQPAHRPVFSDAGPLERPESARLTVTMFCGPAASGSLPLALGFFVKRAVLYR